MPESSQITFTHKEVVSALVRASDLHDGIWGLYLEFGIGAANMGPTPDDVNPAAIIPITKIGLQRFPNISTISVDAAEVNPAPAPSIPSPDQ